MIASMAHAQTATTTTLSVAPNPGTDGQSTTLTATVTGSNPTNSVDFYDGTNKFASANVTSGTARTTKTFSIGTHNLTASYRGDAANAASTSPAVALVVNPVQVTITLTSKSNPSVYGLDNSLQASVTGNRTLNGTVTYYEGNVVLGSKTLSPSANSGTASFTINNLAAGTHSITATYSDDPNNGTNTSAALSQVVNQATTSTNLNASSNPGTYGQPETLTASINNINNGAATGLVTFYDGGATIGTAVPDSSKKATFVTSSLSAGSHTLRANYAGDANTIASNSSNFSLSINQASTSTTLASSKSPSVVGETVTFTATVTGGLPTGTVAFQDGSTAMGSAPLNNGVATFSTASLTAGSHNITASYGGDANNRSSSKSITQSVIVSSTTSLSSSANPAANGQQVTFTATVVGSSPGGTVSFYDGATQLNNTPTSRSGNTATASYSTKVLTSGDHNITASYSGDSNNTPSTSPVLVQTINRIATSISLGVTPTTAAYGTTVALNMNMNTTSSSLSGTFTVYDGASVIKTCNLIPQPTPVTCSTSVNTLAAGSHSLTLQYSGDSNYQPSTSSAVVVQINPATTTTSVVIAPSTVSYGQPQTVSGSVTSVGTVTGVVTILDNGSSIGTANLTGSSYSKSLTLNAGTHNLSASYGGDANNAGSSSGTVAATVNAAVTSIAITSNANPSLYGQPVTWTATVSGGISPSGNVAFKDGATTLGTSTLTGGVASYSSSALAVGAHNITAVYAGDANNASATSSVLAQTVNQGASTATVTSSVNPSSYGQSVTFTVSVTGSAPSGTVTIQDGATTLGTATLSGSGNTTTASYSTGALGTGSHNITAVYGGDTNNAGSTSAALTQIVNPLATSTTVSSSANPAPPGGNVTFTATVTGGSNPSGTVTFSDAGTTLGTANLANGAATYTTSTLGSGTHNITAAYAGDTNNAASTSASLTQTVNAATNTTLGSNANPAAFGATVALTATVTGISPSGTVTFKDGVSTLGTATLASGSATYSTSTLAVGTHSLTAVYGGDVNNAASTSAALTQMINSLPTTTSVASSLNPSNPGQSITFTATVAGGSSPRGAVTFKDGATTLGTGTLSGGSATFVTSSLDPGSHTITAAYGGDANNSASTSAALAQSVINNASTTALNASPAVASPGDTVTLTATVTGNNAPSGTVTFSEGATTLGSATIASGSASISLNTFAAGTHTVTASYAGDANNQPSSATDIVVVASRGPFTWQYGYDAMGRINTQVDPNSLSTYFYYDTLGRRIQMQQPAGTTTGFGWDLQGSLTSVTDPRSLTTGYTVNGLGNTTDETSPDRGAPHYVYDPAGNLASSTDARGKTTTYDYDSLNRIKTISYASGTATTFEYDGGANPTPAEAGELTKMTDESGSTVYAHDAIGRLITKTVTIAGRTFTVAYTWGDSGSALDKLTSITYPSGTVVSYSYDAYGSVSAITVTSAGGVVTPLMTNITYNADGNVTGWLWSDGKARVIGYDANGMIASYTLGDPSGTGNAAGMTRTLTRDGAGRIIGYTHTGSGANGGALDQTFSYDAMNRLTGQSVNGTTYSYTYDANGNRTSKIVAGATYTNTVSSTSSKLTQTQDVNGTLSVQYDAAGNTTNDGVNTYTYNDRGRRASATMSSGSIAFRYNGLEQRAYKSSSLGTSYYVYDEAGQLLGEHDSTGNPVYETIYLGSIPVGVMKTAAGATTTFNVDADQVDTPRVITQQDHTIVWRWDTAEAFGATAPNDSPSGLSRFVYWKLGSGQVFDIETGLIENGHRTLNPRLGRYEQFDPTGLDGGINGYANLESNPLSMVDPLGLLGQGSGASMGPAWGSGGTWGKGGSSPTPAKAPEKCPDCGPDPIVVHLGGVCAAGDTQCSAAMRAAGLPGPYEFQELTLNRKCVEKWATIKAGGMVAGKGLQKYGPNIAMSGARALFGPALGAAAGAAATATAEVMGTPWAETITVYLALKLIVDECKCTKGQ
jgi:RHS repeat-associated protein